MEQTKLDKLKNLVEKNPSDAFVRYGLALEYRNLGLEESARDCFEQLLEENPDYVPTYLQFGQMLIGLDEIERAREVLTRGVEVAQSQGDLQASSELSEALGALDG
jgi:tetratricopeptide (TPR) repeat protein